MNAENAFFRTAIASGHHTIDLDTAWTLLTTKGFADAVSIDDDGDVTGMAEALDRVIARYPWIVSDDLPDDDEPDPPLKPSGRRTNARKDGGHQPDDAALSKRSPALRNKVKAP